MEPSPHPVAEKPNEISTVFFNVESGQLIYADTSKWPWAPVLMDAKGVRAGKP